MDVDLSMLSSSTPSWSARKRLPAGVATRVGAGAVKGEARTRRTASLPRMYCKLVCGQVPETSKHKVAELFGAVVEVTAVISYTVMSFIHLSRTNGASDER